MTCRSDGSGSARSPAGRHGARRGSRSGGRGGTCHTPQGLAPSRPARRTQRRAGRGSGRDRCARETSRPAPDSTRRGGRHRRAQPGAPGSGGAAIARALPDRESCAAPAGSSARPSAPARHPDRSPRRSPGGRRCTGPGDAARRTGSERSARVLLPLRAAGCGRSPQPVRTAGRRSRGRSRSAPVRRGAAGDRHSETGPAPTAVRGARSRRARWRPPARPPVRARRRMPESGGTRAPRSVDDVAWAIRRSPIRPRGIVHPVIVPPVIVPPVIYCAS